MVENVPVTWQSIVTMYKIVFWSLACQCSLDRLRSIIDVMSYVVHSMLLGMAPCVIYNIEEREIDVICICTQDVSA